MFVAVSLAVFVSTLFAKEDKCCGNCRHFANEDAFGNGFCNRKDFLSDCVYSCDLHEYVDKEMEP